MTNSSATNTKPVKRKGPIRTGAVVPATILTVLVGVYFSFFFDGNLRRGMEYALTHINGAEVDVGRVHSSFIHASLEIDDIQVTDKTKPERNTATVGSIRWQMSWDALLRAKVLVDEAEILDIQALSERKHPGYVLPPPPPEDKSKPSAVDELQKQVAQQTAKDFNGNFLGDIAGVLGGADPKDQLKNIQGNLKSQARINELQKELDQKKAQWDQRLKQLPQDKELQGYSARIKALKFDFKNPTELANNVKEAQKIIGEAQDKVKLIDQTQKDLKADVGNYTQQYKDVQKLVDEDMHDLQGRLKIPSIDAKSFSQQLFIQMVEKKLGGMAKYVELARHYMPAKTGPHNPGATAKSEPIVPPKRGTGHSYHFPITTGYPLFWLKHAAISSKANDSEYSGNIVGEIKDLSSDPSYIGRPTLILAHGNFPHQGIDGFDARITIDHTTDFAKETMDLRVDRFPVGQQILSDSPDVKLALTQANGSSLVKAQLVGEQMTVDMQNIFGEAKFDVQAKNSTVKDIIDNVLKGIPTVTMNAEIKGSLSNFAVNINSNLGDELSKGFQKQLQAKIAEAQAQLKKMIDEKIGGPRDKLKSQMDGTFGGLNKNVDGKKGEADKDIKSAQNQLSSSEKGGGKNLEQQGKDLLKGLGF